MNIDFIAEKNGEKIYIQVAYMLFDEATIQREFANLKEIQGYYPKYVVTMGEFTIQNSYYGIKQIHLRDFLFK